MHIFPTLLYVSLVGSSSLPTKGEGIRKQNMTIHSIRIIAKTTLVHITKLRTRLPVGPAIVTIPPSIEGLTSISHDLGLLDNDLQCLLTGLFSQIQVDVSSLEGWVRYLALTMDCPIPARPTGQCSGNGFSDSQHHLTLTTVQHYLETFLRHTDKLRVC